MSNDDFTMDIIAALNKQLSKQRIKSDLKTMDNSMYVKVISKLSIALSQRQLKKDLKQLNDLYLQVGADLKIDSALKKKLQGRIKTLQDSVSDLQIEVSTKKTSDIAKAVTEVRNKGQRAADKTAINFNIEVKREKAIADLEYMAKKYSKLFSNASASSKYNNILDAAYGITDDKQLSSVRAQIAAFTSELKANDLASQSLGDKWKRLIDRAKDLFSAASVVTLIFSQVKQAVSSFLQLDTAMTNLYKVSDDITSRDQFSGLLTKWNKLAQNLAVTTNSLISSMEAWSKIGFNLDMSEQLAEITSIFEKTAEISNEKATSTLISAAQAFTEIDDLGVDDYVKRVEAVGNKINAIGNKYAIDSEGIADGLQNASAALKVAGNDLNETIALITATNKIYQNPEEGSNMLKVASMRLRSQVDALKEMGEDAEGVSTDLTKIQQQVYELTGNKVNIFEDDENLKSTYQMILEIGEVFDSLNDRSQADLLEVMFGKQRASAGASLLLNYEELEKIKNDSMNAANSMAEEYSKYTESAEAHITIFKEKLIETYSTFMSGDLIKYTADLGSGLLDLVNSTDLLKHSILAVLALNIGKGITTVGASIASTVKQMNTLGNALQQVKNLPVDKVLRKEALQELGKETKNLTDKNLKLLLSQKQLEDSDKIRILKAQDLSKEEAKIKLEKMSLLSVTKSQTTANVAEAATTGTLKNAMLSLKTAAKDVGVTIKGMFASNPIGMGLMLATTIISVATSAISKHNQKLEEMRDKAKESADKANTLSNEIAELTNKYLLLSEAVKTDASAKEDLITTQTELLKKLGLEGESIDTLIEKYGSLSNAIKQASIDSLKNAQIDLIAGVSAAQEELLDVAKDNFWGTNNIISATGEDAVKAFKVLEKAGIVNSGSFGSAGGSLVLTGDETVDGALENFKKLEDAINALRDSSEFTMSELSNNSLFQAIYDRYNEMKNGVDSYNSSIENLNANLSQQIMLTALQGQEVPKTEEEFNTFRQELIDTAVASKQFIGNEEDITEAIDGYLSTVPEFEGYYSVPLENELNKVDDLLSKKDYSKSISSSIQQIATQLEPQFAKLGETYQEIFKLDDNGKEKFSLDSIDNSMLEELRQTFAEIKDEIGVTFDTSKLEPFFDTLTNGNSTAGQVQQAFNDLATAYLYSTDTLEQLNSETADAIALQLEELGVQNAAEIVAEALTAKTEELTVAKEYLAQTGKDLASATEEERTAFILEQIEAGNCGEALALLQLKKMLANQSTITTADDCQNILDLATAANIGIIKLQQLQTLMNMITQRDAAVQSGDSRAVSELNRAINEFSNSVINNLNLEDIDVDFGDIGGGKSGASKAGKDAGDAYINAFQKEYDHLKGLLDRGEISESQYLNRLRTLYTRYFKDRKEYLDEFKKYESEYLSGMLELHNKALSGISTLLNQKINAANEAKDTVVSALQEEKEAAADAYQAQIDDIEKEKEAIDDLIKEKNKKIDALNEEADAIQKAAETRKKNIDLQQQEFNLQKMLNQRTKSVYKEGEGFVFETDTTGIRDAREKVKEAKEAIEIDRLKNEADLIQKEIDLLEEKKDSLTEQQEALQKLMDESNKYYDNLIKQQEKMWDSMVKNMEQQKSKWEELSDIQQIAEAYSAIQQVFGELGYSVEDVLNGSESAFEDFKSKYISLISDVNSNSDFTEGLVYATGVAKENLGSFLEKTKETADGLSELGEKGSGMDSVAESMDKLSDSATTASEGTSSIATSMGELSTSTEGISDNLTSINDAITDLPEADKLDGLAAKFTNLGKAIQAVADVLGIGEEGVVSTLVSALQEISTLSLDGSGGEEGSGNSGGGIISQFKSLKTAVEDVTSAISGGRSSGSKEGDASDSLSESMSFGVNGEGADGLISAIEEIKPAADESLGGDGESSGTIPQFQELRTAVDDVTAAIGTADTEGGALSESTTLIGAIRAQYETASETLPETTALFEELLESIMSCVGALNSMVSLMGSMSEIGGFGSHNISATPDTKDAGGNAHADGTANNPVTTNMYPEMPLWERMEKCAAALGRTMDDMLNPLNSLALDIRKETGMGRFLESINNTSNITNNNKNVQPVVHNTFNITMPNVTDSTTATSLMNDLQSLATKKFQMDW